MNDPVATGEIEDDPMVACLLARARELDPASQEVSVRRFWSEMEDARQALEGLGPVDDPLPVAFDPAWNRGGAA